MITFCPNVHRNTSHAGLEAAREAAFQRAMTLMTNRCDSKQRAVEQGGLFSFNLDASYGPKCPQYFYVQQRKPAPMAPLKVVERLALKITLFMYSALIVTHGVEDQSVYEQWIVTHGVEDQSVYVQCTELSHMVLKITCWLPYIVVWLAWKMWVGVVCWCRTGCMTSELW